MEYVAFEIGRGGPRQPRRPAADLLSQWNQALAAVHAGIEFRAAFRATGNYVLRSAEPQSVSSIATVLEQQLHRKFVVFKAEEFLDWLEALQRDPSEAPTVSIAREPNRGAIMDLNPAGDIPGPLPAPIGSTDPEAWTSSEFAIRRVRGVWKNDRLRADGARDQARRDGTWGALSHAMRRAYGGDWTARALGTLLGLASRVRMDRPDVAPQTGSIETPEPSGVPHATAPTQDISTLLRSVAQASPISRAIGALLEAHQARGSAIHVAVHARRIAELLARQVCQAHRVDVAGRTFVELCRDIANRNLLGETQQTYLHALRKLGNFAAHEAQEGDIDFPDVQVVLWMLFALVSDAPATCTPSRNLAQLRQSLGDPALAQLYRNLADEDVALAEEGLAEYRRQLNAADGA